MNPIAQPGGNGFDPLDGIRVVDFTKVLAGPLCTQYLGDLGADVIKIEPPRHGDDTRQWPPFEDATGTIFLSVNRNKRSVAIDLKSAEGRKVIERLVKSADVVIESFGPGVAERLAIDHATLSKINPRIVYCSISGYGTEGPMKDGKGYDVILQAFCGMLSITGEPAGPPVRSPFSPVDQGTGLHAVIGILGGLLQRGKTGKGVKIEASLFDSAVHFLAYFLQGYWKRGTEPVRPGSGHESLCPYQTFDTADKPLILGVANDALWVAFCEIAGVPELGQDPRFVTGAERVRHRSETVTIVTDILKTRGRDAWLTALDARGIPCSPLHTLGELSSHPHTKASGMVVDYEGAEGRRLHGVTAAIRTDGARQPLRRRPPALGEHTIEVLGEIGYTAAEIRTLGEAGVVDSCIISASSGA